MFYHQILQPQIQSPNETQVINLVCNAAKPLNVVNTDALTCISAALPTLVGQFAEMDFVEAPLAKHFCSLAQHMQMTNIQVTQNLFKDILHAKYISRCGRNPRMCAHNEKDRQAR